MEEDLANNIAACVELAQCISSTLGPCGMDKLLMDNQENILVSNDGATLLSHLAIQQPAALLLTQISKAQDDQVGDGTTSVVLLSASLLHQAKHLITEKNVHANHVIQGFRKCMSIAQEQLLKYSIPVDLEQQSILEQIAKTTIGSKIISADCNHFVNMSVDCANTMFKEFSRRNMKPHLNNFFVHKIVGTSMSQSTVLDGCIVKKQLPLNSPQRILNAKVLVGKMDYLESARTKFYNSQITVKSHQQASDINTYEKEILIEACNRIIKCGINVIFNSGHAIHPIAQSYLFKNNILCVGHVDFKTAHMLSIITGCPIYTQISENDIESANFGFAECVEQVVIAEEKMIKLSGCNSNSKEPWCSVLLRAPTRTLLDECERSMHDSMCILLETLKCKRYVAGGGCMYIHIAQYLRSIISKQSGVMRLVIEAYAQALESIPTTLARNAGLQSSQLVSEMCYKHSQFIEQSSSQEKLDKDYDGIKYPFIALDLRNGKVCDNALKDIKVIEPVSVMKHILDKSMDAAEMILRIDRNLFLKPEATIQDLGLY
jgi:T-complex protein 1 subunit beta